MKALLKISPILILAGFILSGFDILIAAPLATIYAALIAFLTEKLKTQEIINAAVDNVKEMQIVFFILMCAYVMAEAFMATGVGASIINISLDLGITGRSVAVVGLIVTSMLSIATGTSWGTFAACAPVFLWLSHILGGDIILTIAAIAGGSCFGDNIGLISETTVVSSGIQKVEVIDRIRHQGVWSALVLVFGVIAFYVAGIVMNLPTGMVDAKSAIDSIPEEAWVSLLEKRPSAVTLLEQVKAGTPVYMVIPLIIVLVAAFSGISTIICLFIGIVASLVFGLMEGTVTDVNAFLEMMYNGFSSAGSWVIVMMMWIGAFGGIMLKMNAFEPISRLVIRASRNIRQLMFCNGALSILGNAALADEMAQIVTIGPILKDIVEHDVEGSEEDLYKLRLRNATFSDALGVFGSQLIPWHVYISFYIGIASAVYPLYEFTAVDIIKYNFMAMFAVVSILLLTLTGFDRFIPLFRLPSEPNVRLKKKKEKIMVKSE